MIYKTASDSVSTLTVLAVDEKLTKYTCALLVNSLDMANLFLVVCKFYYTITVLISIFIFLL